MSQTVTAPAAANANAAKATAPDTPSSAYIAMQADWQMIRDIRGGARVIREAREVYLDKFTGEPADVYTKRVKNSPWSPIYEDSTRTLAAKPFSREVNLAGDVPEQIRTWCENIDYAGKNLHNVAKALFEEALHMGLVFFLVDYTATGSAPSLAAERAAGGRPFWRIIPADDMFGLVLGVRNGKTYIRQIRFRDDRLELNGFEERVVFQVRVLDDIDGRLTSTLWVKTDDEWSEGTPTEIKGSKITEIPLVPIIFGLPLTSAFSVKPPMLDLAHKQIEHYRHSNRLDNHLQMAGFAMLQAEGMGPQTVEVEDAQGNKSVRQVAVEVGPHVVLYSPPANPGDRPKWSWLGPPPEAYNSLSSHQKKLETEMKELGLQPTMPQIGAQNMAATTSAINAARSHSLIQAWAFSLKDGLEQGLVYTAQWDGLAETAEADVKTDFSADILNDADEKLLFEMVVAGVISWDTYIDEMLRRDLLGPSFDKEAERKRVEDARDLKMKEDAPDDPADRSLRADDDPTGTGGPAE